MLQTDEAKSISRFIYNSLPGSGISGKPEVFYQRPQSTTARPYFKIDNPAGPKTMLTPQWYQDRRVWIVTYFAAKNQREDTQVRGDAWLRKLYNDPKYKMLDPRIVIDSGEQRRRFNEFSSLILLTRD